MVRTLGRQSSGTFLSYRGIGRRNSSSSFTRELSYVWRKRLWTSYSSRLQRWMRMIQKDGESMLRMVACSGSRLVLKDYPNFDSSLQNHLFHKIDFTGLGWRLSYYPNSNIIFIHTYRMHMLCYVLCNYITLRY